MKSVPPPPRPDRYDHPEAKPKDFTLRDGTRVRVRPITPVDEARLAQFHQTLSEQSVYFRYFSVLSLAQRIAHPRLLRICASEPAHDLVLLAEVKGEIAGVARLSTLYTEKTAEFAILVGDQWQGRGLGTRLLALLIECGRAKGLEAIVGSILPENHEMQNLCRKAGFALHHEFGEPEVLAEFKLHARTQRRAAPLSRRSTAAS